MPENDLLLPAGSRLLHIGPSKTGTTAIQGALRQAREVMASHGVIYPGKERQHRKGARVLAEERPSARKPPKNPKNWDRLIRQVNAAGDRRVIISAEVFSKAEDAAAAAIVTALGGPRVHVVVTLRPLVKVVASSWQQQVRQGLRLSYEDWLKAALCTPPQEGGAPGFWHRHVPDVLVERWASVVGAENLTVIAQDDSDRLMLLRVFERLVGLPDGLLRLDERTNASLTFGEIEVVRHLNIEFRRRGWGNDRHRALIRRGLVPHLQQHAGGSVPEGQRIRTPAWAAERVAEIGTAAAEKIGASGVRVVGDVGALAWLPADYRTASAPQAVVPSETAMQAVLSVILASTKRGAPPARAAEVPAPRADVARVVPRRALR